LTIFDEEVRAKIHVSEELTNLQPLKLNSELSPEKGILFKEYRLPF